MKVYISPRAQALIDDPLTGPFMTAAIDESIRHGFDTIKKEHNPLYDGCQNRLWWEDSCPLVVFHNKAGDYALVCEKPLHAGFPSVQMPYYQSLLPLCQEMNIV